MVHQAEVNWGVYAGLFLYIDLIGYISGFVRSSQLYTSRIGRGYCIAYTVIHPFLAVIPVTLVVATGVSAIWSALAVLVHIAGDRALLRRRSAQDRDAGAYL